MYYSHVLVILLLCHLYVHMWDSIVTESRMRDPRAELVEGIDSEFIYS